MKKIYIILIVCLFAFNANAQQDPQYTQYMYNMNVINPAYAGTTEGLAVGVLYRSQWAGLDAPHEHPNSARAFRQEWIEKGCPWDLPEWKPKNWSLEEQLKNLPKKWR